MQSGGELSELAELAVEMDGERQLIQRQVGITIPIEDPVKEASIQKESRKIMMNADGVMIGNRPVMNSIVMMPIGSFDERIITSSTLATQIGYNPKDDR